MSEQTPDQSGDALEGLGAEGEPSMEDILASIRQIIADDADPVPLDAPLDVSESVAPETIAAPLPDVSELIEPVDNAPVDSLAGEEIVTADTLDIDALLSGLDVVEPELPPLTVDTVDATLDDAPIELDIPMMPDEPEVDPLAPKALGERAAESLLATPEPQPVSTPTVTPDVVAAADDDELDSLMDELLADLDVSAEPETVVDPAESLLADADADADIETARDLPEIDSGEDMDLVKSLMADLTDEDVSADVLADDAVMLDDASVDDVLDDILDMTLDDAIAEQPLDIPEPEPEPVAEGAAEPAAEAADPAPSLSDIAASADADADASATPVVAATAAGAALMGGATLAQAADPVTDEAEIEATVDLAPEHTDNTSTQVETPMPRAARKDTILDDVTEEATMSAFAELNTVVEEKAVFNERGPRIGDLVQEALKPMLKEWLDANLKGIVERAVAKEVKRISTGK